MPGEYDLGLLWEKCSSSTISRPHKAGVFVHTFSYNVFSKYYEHNFHWGVSWRGVFGIFKNGDFLHSRELILIAFPDPTENKCTMLQASLQGCSQYCHQHVKVKQARLRLPEFSTWKREMSPSLWHAGGQEMLKLHYTLEVYTSFHWVAVCNSPSHPTASPTTWLLGLSL